MGKNCFDNLRDSRGTYKEPLHESPVVTEESPGMLHLDGLVAGTIWPEDEYTGTLYPYCTFLASRTSSFELVWPLHCDKSQLRDGLASLWSARLERQVRGVVLCLYPVHGYSCKSLHSYKTPAQRTYTVSSLSVLYRRGRGEALQL